MRIAWQEHFMMDSVNEATATALPVRAGGPINRSSASREKLRSSEVYSWTLSAKGKILWVDLVEDTEDPEPQFEGPQNYRALVIGRMLGLFISRRKGL